MDNPEKGESARKKKKPGKMSSRKKKAITILVPIVCGIIGAAVIGYYLNRQRVWDAAATPELVLPIQALSNVSAVQVFYNNASPDIHTGYDFYCENATDFVSPVVGNVYDIKKVRMNNGFWMVTVHIRFNVRWSTLLAFEPGTKEETYADAQAEWIWVNIGDAVGVNQSIGKLRPDDPAGSHIHWNVNEDNLDGGHIYDWSPYALCTPGAKEHLWDLSAAHGKYPSDCPTDKIPVSGDK